MKKPIAAHPEDVRTASVLRWSAAAATGLCLMGCPDGSEKEAPGEAKPEAKAAAAPVPTPEGDKECCMGKNDCKGKGGCAVPESNDCAGKNDCKAKGGCNMHCPK